jgi:hypothetical protein
LRFSARARMVWNAIMPSAALRRPSSTYRLAWVRAKRAKIPFVRRLVFGRLAAAILTRLPKSCPCVN